MATQEQAACPHTEQRPVENQWIDPSGNEAVEVERIAFSTMDDIDLRRMKYRLCGKVGYYSEAARAFYEDGIRSPGISGLE
ncbi:hypothetical protein LMG29542_02237 [Paraburkholderia humisilvae]|uniref:Uncharacterized protein n=2 Tax=Paraburkholderia humisilvae TaxID=627669 RepID=A0A6J5DML8_9BURK|nr:hypothetical protein LMG29542_02237 [Paraburkholderia humisilvae]